MKLSVAMCTYNGEKHIKTQLDSILHQSIAVDQIIICDDGSTDKTIKIIEQYQLENPKVIKLIKNSNNLGSNKNFEKAISICDGDFIFLSDQDDIWKEDKVKKIIQHFSENESTEAVFSNAELINEKDEPFTERCLWNMAYFLEEQLTKPIDLFRLLKFKSNMVTGATLCIKKEVKDFILPIPNMKDCYHDEWIAIIIASRKKLDYLSDKLTSYRIHSGQQTENGRINKKNKEKKYLLFTNHILGNAIPESYIDYKRLANTYYRNYLKFKMIFEQKENKYPINFNEIAEENLMLFVNAEHKLKKINPFLYFFRKRIDKLKGIRQLS